MHKIIGVSIRRNSNTFFCTDKVNIWIKVYSLLRKYTYLVILKINRWSYSTETLICFVVELCSYAIYIIALGTCRSRLCWELFFVYFKIIVEFIDILSLRNRNSSNKFLSKLTTHDNKVPKRSWIHSSFSSNWTYPR